MSFIEQSIRDYLGATSAVTAIFGTKIFSGHIPQGTAMPALNFSIVGGNRLMSLEGVSGLERRQYRFNVWTDKTDIATLISGAEAVSTALNGYRGTMGSTYSMNVQRIMLNETRDFFEPDSEVHQRVLEFDIDYCV